MTDEVESPSRQADGSGPVRVRALDRGLQVLEVLSGAPELSLTEIAQRVGLAFSTTHRILESLKFRQFASQSISTGKYSVGVRAYEVGARFISSTQLPQAAHPIMAELVVEVNETVNLAVRDGQEAIYIHQVESDQNVRMFTRLGARAPLHCSGVGKVLLAWLPRTEQDGLVFKSPLTAFTPKTLIEAQALFEELRLTTKRGFAVDMEEFELGVRCVAAPVRNQRGKVVAALSVSGPLPRFSSKLIGRLRKEVVCSAREVSARLGWIEGNS
jgi:DNA-binding IclR family transcriptional regulator